MNLILQGLTTNRASIDRIAGMASAARIVPLDRHVIGGPELMRMLAEDEDGADAAGSDS